MTLITIALGIAIILGVVAFLHEKKISSGGQPAPDPIHELHKAEDEQYP